MKKHKLSEGDLDALILRDIISDPDKSDDDIKKELDLSSMCDDFVYDDVDLDIRIAVVRLERKGWK